MKAWSGAETAGGVGGAGPRFVVGQDVEGAGLGAGGESVEAAVYGEAAEEERELRCVACCVAGGEGCC